MLAGGEQFQGEMKYYDYGVVSVVFELPFTGGWDKLIALASRWVWEVDFAAQAAEIVRERLERVTSVQVKPYQKWLSEDYLIFHIREINMGQSNGSYSAMDLLQQHGSRIAQVVRGDTGKLAESECNEVLQSRISYYATDLTVIGWNARMDGIQGAVLRVKLRRLEEWNNQRRAHAQRYLELLADVDEIALPTEADYARHVYHVFAVRLARRDEILAKLARRPMKV